MKIRDDVNEFGTPITIFRCEFCGEIFSVCPAVPECRLNRWMGCTRPECDSYDEGRDVDKMIEEGVVVLKRETMH